MTAFASRKKNIATAVSLPTCLTVLFSDASPEENNRRSSCYSVQQLWSAQLIEAAQICWSGESTDIHSFRHCLIPLLHVHVEYTEGSGIWPVARRHENRFHLR